MCLVFLTDGSPFSQVSPPTSVSEYGFGRDSVDKSDERLPVFVLVFVHIFFCMCDDWFELCVVGS